MNKQMPVVFIHPSKTAGSSLTAMLIDALDPTEQRSFKGLHALDQAVDHGWRDCAVVAGHFAFTAVQAIGRPCHLVTLLRDPIARAQSLYRFSHTITDEEAAQINCAMTNLAKASDAAAFFRQAPAEIAANFSNAQTRQLLGEDWVGFAARGAWDEALALAKARLAGLSGFAISEDFERSCRFLFSSLRMPLIHVREDNRLADRMDRGHAIRTEFAPIDDDLRQSLEQMNLLDRALYDFAVALNNERIAGSQVGDPQRLAA